MKILSKKQTQLYDERMMKMRALEIYFEINLDDMTIDDISDWYRNYKLTSFINDWYSGAQAGTDSACNALEKHGVLAKSTVEKIRYRSKKQIEEDKNEKLKELDN